MTELLLRTVSRLPLQRLARPSAVLAFALPFAYLGGLWLIWLHIVEGGHERNEPSLLVHALRDGTVALPLSASPSGAASSSPGASSRAGARRTRASSPPASSSPRSPSRRPSRRG